MSHNLNFQKIVNQIQSGKPDIHISENFRNYKEDSLRLVKTIINTLEKKKFEIDALYFENIHMVFSKEAITLLTKYLKTNKTISELYLKISFEDIEQAFIDIGNLFRNNKTLHHFGLFQDEDNEEIENFNKSMKYLTYGLSTAKLYSLSFAGAGLESKGASEIAKIIRNPNTVLDNLNLTENYISKNSFKSTLLPALRKNVSLTTFSLDDALEYYEDQEEIQALVDFELSKNRIIQEWWEEYRSPPSGFFTKAQQKYIKGKSNQRGTVQNFNTANVPLDVRFMIQAFIPKNFKSNIDKFMNWIQDKKEDAYERRAILTKLRNYKKSFQDKDTVFKYESKIL